MKAMFEFVCDTCGVFDRYIDSALHTAECDCGSTGKRIISAPAVRLDGTDPSFPGAYERWAKIREDNARIKARKEQH